VYCLKVSPFKIPGKPGSIDNKGIATMEYFTGILAKNRWNAGIDNGNKIIPAGKIPDNIPQALPAPEYYLLFYEEGTMEFPVKQGRRVIITAA